MEEGSGGREEAAKREGLLLDEALGRAYLGTPNWRGGVRRLPWEGRARTEGLIPPRASMQSLDVITCRGNLHWRQRDTKGLECSAWRLREIGTSAKLEEAEVTA